MEASFWHNKWEMGQIGFHESEANPLLVAHIDKLDLNKGDKIFLPLCGKTLDISFLLSQGYQVVGVEFSELAIKELFQQLELTPKITTEGKYTRYQAQGIDIFIGDFFDLNAEILGNIDAIYDRASLIALSEGLRQQYTKQLCEITACIKQLLICVDYDQAQMNGPPFSIDANMVHQYYEGVYSLNCIARNEIIGGLKRIVKAYESIWILNKLS